MRFLWWGAKDLWLLGTVGKTKGRNEDSERMPSGLSKHDVFDCMQINT
jgi:hypothetical protein